MEQWTEYDGVLMERENRDGFPSPPSLYLIGELVSAGTWYTFTFHKPIIVKNLDDIDDTGNI